jgi:hypothetical protein
MVLAPGRPPPTVENIARREKVKKAAIDVTVTLGVKVGGAALSACELATHGGDAASDFSEGRYWFGVLRILGGLGDSGIAMGVAIVSARKLTPQAVASVKAAIQADKKAQAATARARVKERVEEDVFKAADDALEGRAAESVAAARSVNDDPPPPKGPVRPGTRTLRALHYAQRRFIKEMTESED